MPGDRTEMRVCRRTRWVKGKLAHCCCHYVHFIFHRSFHRSQNVTRCVVGTERWKWKIGVSASRLHSEDDGDGDDDDAALQHPAHTRARNTGSISGAVFGDEKLNSHRQTKSSEVATVAVKKAFFS